MDIFFIFLSDVNAEKDVRNKRLRFVLMVLPVIFFPYIFVSYEKNLFFLFKHNTQFNDLKNK